MTSGRQFTPDGYHTVTPYLTIQGAGRLIDFVRQAFGAEEIERMQRPDGTIAHAAVRIGDSIVEMAEARGEWPAMPGALHLYVPDVDATYRRALQLGATSLHEPKDMEYGERGAGLRDLAGNNWYIATYTGHTA